MSESVYDYERVEVSESFVSVLNPPPPFLLLGFLGFGSFFFFNMSKNELVERSDEMGVLNQVFIDG